MPDNSWQLAGVYLPLVPWPPPDRLITPPALVPMGDLTLQAGVQGADMVRFNISAKLLTAFSLLLAIMAVMGLFAVQKIGEVDALSAEMRSRWLPAAQTLGDIHTYLSQYRIKQGDMIDAPSDRTEKLVRNAEQVIGGLLDDYGRHAEGKQKSSLDVLRQGWAAYTAQNATIAGAARANDPSARALFQGEALDRFYAMEDTVLAMIDQDGKAAAEVSNRSAQIYASARMVLIGAIIGGLCAAIGLMGMLMFNIARPLARMSEAVGRLVAGDMAVHLPGMGRSDEIGALAAALDRFKDLVAADVERAAAEKARAAEARVTIEAIGGGLAALAAGDLSHRVPENGDGVLAKLHVDYNTAVGALSTVLAKIVEGCTTIQTGTMEIASAANDLSLRSEQQASSIAETARTLGEFTGTVRITADNARQTSSRLGVARTTAGTVEDIARRAIEAMRSIEETVRLMDQLRRFNVDDAQANGAVAAPAWHDRDPQDALFHQPPAPAASRPRPLPAFAGNTALALVRILNATTRKDTEGAIGTDLTIPGHKRLNTLQKIPRLAPPAAPPPGSTFANR
eukprot:gene11223-11306_t